MKILVWNLMRPNVGTASRSKFFLDRLTEENADIIILTETNTLIHPQGNYYSLSSAALPNKHEGIEYKEGERLVMIFSRYAFIREITTSDPATSVCGEVETPLGKLIIYGTVIGCLGGMKEPFNKDLETQSLELVELVKQGSVLFGGDLNISFSKAYPTRDAVATCTKLFDKLSLTNLTQHFPNNAIHCVISNSFIENKNIEGCRESFDKKITDHSLITITIQQI